jgi:hypothetical protein
VRRNSPVDGSKLAAPSEEEFAGGRVAAELERRILVHESAERGENFILFPL